MLAFMINATVEEVDDLVKALRDERDELRRTQEHLIHAAKLSALGQLAGGVTHELNQPLTAIRILVTTAQARMRAGHPGLSLEELDLLGEAAGQMGGTVDAVRTFARRNALRPEPIHAAEPLRHALRLMQPCFHRDEIVVDVALADDLPAIVADADRLQQVMVNLLANARDAVMTTQRHPQGRVSVAARADDHDVIYTVEDDGPGVPHEMRDLVFDPFFTTKKVGEGTGLGLSISYGIVEEHGGTIVYENAEGGGARFVVRIPQSGPAAS